MKKKLLSMVLISVMGIACLTGCGEQKASGTNDESAKSYKVGIVQYVDDASLNQIETSIEKELDAKAKELGVVFDYKKYNGQADSTVLNQIASDLVADKVDVIIPIATPAAMVMQNATEENQIPVIFSAVTDPVSAGLVESLDAPGSNITGTSDALDTEAVMKLILAANQDTKKIGLLYNKSEDSSTKAIQQAKDFCDANSIEYVEKTGTTSDEIALAADALVAAGVDAVFTPTDNTVQVAEISIYEKFVDAKIPHYAGADSFALNGAFCGYGVNYEELGTATADMAIDVLVNSKKPADTAVKTLDNGIATVNTDTASALGLDYEQFGKMCEELKTTTTQKEFK